MRIRVRLTLVTGALMALVVAAMGAFLYLRLAADLTNTVDAGLRSRAEALLASGDPILAGGGLVESEVAFAQLLDASGAVLGSSSGLRDPLLAPDQVDDVTGTPLLLDARVAAAEEVVPARLLAIRTADGRVLVVGASVEEQDEALARLLALLLVGGPVAVLLACGVGWVVAGAALGPVERLRQEADAVSGDGRRLTVPGSGDELTRLAESLNRMLDRMEAALARERRFVDDASHELRTPLANLRTELELARAPGRSHADLETAVASASEETERLIRLAEDLLVLARSDNGRLPLRREHVDLAALVREVAAGFRHRSPEVTIAVQAGDVPAEVDPLRMRQVVGNLLDNALRHTPAGGAVSVAVTDGDAGIELSVHDTGDGFAPEFLPHAFEPFSRADGSRTRAGGGTGLGLAIVAAIVAAHGGSVSVANDGGARVTVRLPH